MIKEAEYRHTVNVESEIWSAVSWCKKYLGYITKIQQKASNNREFCITFRSEVDFMAFKLTFHGK